MKNIIKTGNHITGETVTLFFPGKKQKAINALLGHVTHLPLALLAIAPYIIQENCRVRIVDNRVGDTWPDDYSNDLFVGVTSKTGAEVKNCIDFIRHVKARNPYVPIVWGGVHASILPDVTLMEDYVDYVVRGPGEEAVAKLIRALRGKMSLDDIEGLSYKKEGRIVQVGFPRPVDVDKLEMPAFDLVDAGKYKNLSKSVDYESSRGCPHRCAFCYNISMGNYRKWQGKSPEKVVQEIEYILNRFNPASVDFVDDYVFVDAKRIERILQLVSARKIRFNWSASCRIDQFSKFSDEFVKFMAEKGLRKVFFGAESHSEKILRLLHKEYEYEMALAVIEKCKRSGIIPVFNYIIGFPGEDYGDISVTLNGIKHLKAIFNSLEISAISVYIPFPGSSLFSDCQQLGMKSPDTLEKWSSWQFVDRKDFPWLDKKKAAYTSGIYFTFRIKYIIDEIISRVKNGNKMISFLFRFLVFPLDMLERWRIKNDRYLYHAEGKIIQKALQLLLADII